jgi:hypothetical protein
MKMLKQNLEQCCANKFYVKLSENARETCEKLKWPYGDHALSRAQVFMWHKVFWMTMSVWKTNLVLEDLAHQKRKKMWPTRGLLWGLFSVWQSQCLVVSWISFTKTSTAFWPRNLHAGTWMLHLYHAPCRTAISVNEVLTKNGIPVVPKLPYSPDLSPCDLFLFSKLKFHKRSNFETIDDI